MRRSVAGLGSAPRSWFGARLGLRYACRANLPTKPDLAERCSLVNVGRFPVLAERRYGGLDDLVFDPFAGSVEPLVFGLQGRELVKHVAAFRHVGESTETICVTPSAQPTVMRNGLRKLLRNRSRNWRSALLPSLSDLYRANLGRIYVLLLDTGEFKVGYTQNIRSRINLISGDLRRRRYGPTRIVDGWYSCEYRGYKASETRLIAFCLEHFGDPTQGAEVFKGDFARTVTFAERLVGEAYFAEVASDAQVAAA